MNGMNGKMLFTRYATIREDMTEWEDLTDAQKVIWDDLAESVERTLRPRNLRFPRLAHLRKVRTHLERLDEVYDPDTMRAGRKYTHDTVERKRIANELDYLIDAMEVIVDDLIGDAE